MSKIETGSFSLNEDYFTSEELVGQVVSVMEGMALVKNISVCTAGFNDSQEFYGDIRVLRQTLMNLVSNAIKFSPEHSSVLLEMLPNSAGGCEICVCDNGPGMDRESLQKALEPFVQVESGYNKRFEGSGLGLPLVKAFVEAHGGNFSLESTQGIGTRAKIQLPPNRCYQMPRLRYVGW